MRKLLFLFMLICTMQLHGQTVREWMGLPPVPVEFPAFGDMKNVENKIFSQADLLTLSTFNIENLTPAPMANQRTTISLSHLGNCNRE